MKNRRNFLRAGFACAAFFGSCALSGCIATNTVAPTEPCRFQSMMAGKVVLRSATLANAGIRVRNVSGGKKTDPRKLSNIGNVGLRKAVEYSLSRCGLLAEFGEYVLDVTLVQEDARREGAAFIVEEKAFYSLRERRSGARVFEETVAGGGQASAADAPLGARLRVAKERAMRMNIENFLIALDRAFLRKEREKTK